MNEERVKINGLNIEYKTVGEGDPILILHGWGSFADRWRTVAKLLAGYNFSVIIPDLPGFGNSNAPDSVWGFDDYCKLVEEFRKALGLGKIRLLGHSFGGNIAITYAIKHPENLVKLYLVGAASIRDETVRKKTVYAASKTFRFLRFIEPLKKFIYRIIKSDYGTAKGIMKKIYLKVIKIDLRDRLSEVKTETLLIWGERDNITPLSHARMIQEGIAGSRLEIVPRLGHNLHSEAPGLLANIIIGTKE